MTNQLEYIGFRAIIQDLETYLGGAKRMEAANLAVERAETQVTVASAKLQGTWTQEQQKALQLTQAKQNLSLAVEKEAAAHEKSSKAIEKAAEVVGVLLATYASEKGLEHAIEKTVELGDQTFRLQQITGLTAEQASTLIFAADKQGVAFDQLSAGLRIFSKNMLTVQEANDGFAGGAKTTKEVLEGMGIKVLDVNGKLKPLNELLDETADFFAKDHDATEKAGLAMQLFGRAGASLVPVLQLGSRGLEEAAAEAQKLHVQLSEKNVQSIHEFVLAQRDAQSAIAGIEVSIGLKLLPQLTALANYFIAHQGDFLAFFDAAEKDIGVFASAFADGFSVVKDLFTFIPAHQVEVIGAFGAIAAAALLAFGPASVFALALGTFITAVGKAKEVGQQIAGGVSSSQDQKLKAQAAKIVGDAGGDEQATLKKIAKLQADGSKESLLAAGYLSKALEDANKKTRAAADSQSSLGRVQATAAEIQEELKDKIISYDEAQKYHQTAIEAGRLEGLQAIKDAEDKGKRDAFDYASTIAAVATAMRSSAAAGETLQLTLSKNALKGEQGALSDIFARPTVEVAQLQLSLDQVKLANDRLRPSIEADRDAHKDAADAIQAAGDAEAATLEANATAVASSFQNLGDAIDKQVNELNASLDRLNQSFSDEDAKIKQQQQQRDRDAQDQIRRSNQNLDAQQRALQDQIQSVQDQKSGLPSGASQSSKNALDAQIKDLQDQLQKLQDSQSNYSNAVQDYTTQIQRGDEDAQAARDKQRKFEENQLKLSLDDAKRKKDENDKAAKKAEDAAKADEEKLKITTKDRVETEKKLADADDKRLKSMDGQEKAIENQIKIYQEQSQIWKDEATLADKTLLTQENQRVFAHILTEQISITSGQVHDLELKLGQGLNPQVAEATRLYLLANSAYGITANTVIPGLNQDLANAGHGVSDLVTQMRNAFASAGINQLNPVGGGGNSLQQNIDNKFAPKSKAFGGFTGGAPELTMLHPKEVVLPLNNPQRSRELMASMPPGMTQTPASIIGGGGPQFNYSIQGDTLESMRRTALAATNRAFDEAESKARRSGALLSSSLG